METKEFDRKAFDFYLRTGYKLSLKKQSKREKTHYIW